MRGLWERCSMVRPGVGLVCIVVPWLIYLYVRINRNFSANMTAAMKLMPSPTEISWQMQGECGHPPTVQEAAAVHQMLTSDDNQALLNTGITLGAVYLMDKNLH